MYTADALIMRRKRDGCIRFYAEFMQFINRSSGDERVTPFLVEQSMMNARRLTGVHAF
jgi:hypothetical protein